MFDYSFKSPNLFPRSINNSEFGCGIFKDLKKEILILFTMQRIVPENTHTRPTEGNVNSEGKGALIGGIFRGGGGGFLRSFFWGSK